MAGAGFEVVCEIEPPSGGDLGGVREQIVLLKPVCDAFLVPDSHLGRATVSSLVVAHEVQRLGGRAIACMNARDRNLLGFRRDLLTAAALDLRDLLFVYGDDPSEGGRSALTVRRMLAERSNREIRGSDGQPVTFRVGVAADVRRPLPSFKRSADRAFTQLSFDVEAVSSWPGTSGYDGRVYAGVVVLASERMARRLARTIPGFEVPEEILARLRADRAAGVEVALEQVRKLRERGTVDGVHLVPATRYREVAEALDGLDL